MIGSLRTVPALERPDLVAAPVRTALGRWTGDALVAEIDPGLADTAAFCAAYDVPPEVSANCVVVAGSRSGAQRVAACLVLATTRVDVNRVVRRLLDVRKASFLATDEAVARTSMEYGGITPIGVPADWAVLVDPACLQVDSVVVGSGLRRSKIVLRGREVASLPGVRIVPGLGR